LRNGPFVPSGGRAGRSRPEAAAFRLANHVWNAGLALLCAIAMIVPIVRVAVRVVVVVKVSGQLPAGGAQVGFFGADPNAI
jgi:hypothetical protein